MLVPPVRESLDAVLTRFGDRAGLLAAIAAMEARRVARAAARPLRLSRRIRPTVPERLILAPEDIRTADPAVADDFYAGHLAMAGRFVDAHGQSPFEVAPPSLDWAAALHGFGWLRHLRAADTALARANARALVDDWMTHGRSHRAGVAWQPEVVARRVLSWLAQSPLILDPPDPQFHRKLMRSIGRQTALLQNGLAGGMIGYPRLLASIAVAQAGLCADGLSGARRQGSRSLTEELRRQILPDGGHVSREPDVLVEVLMELLPLRQAYTARGAPVPPALLNAIDRIVPMLRMFCHDDGNIALFNGVGVTDLDALATVLTYDDVHAQPLGNAIHSGFQRLEGGAALLLCDVGRPPPPAFSRRAHAGTASFEFSVGPQRIIVNCGRPHTDQSAAVAAARSTAAHSTLVIGDASSARFAGQRLRRWFGDQIVAGPKRMEVTRDTREGALRVEVSHDGYARRFNMVHKRRWALAQDGQGLFGRDELKAAKPRREGQRALEFAIRFHLHPSVKAAPDDRGKSVTLTLPSSDIWVFEASGQDVRIEESIFFAVAEGARRTDQIVIPCVFPDRTTIHWSLLKSSAPVAPPVPP